MNIHRKINKGKINNLFTSDVLVEFGSPDLRENSVKSLENFSEIDTDFNKSLSLTEDY